MLSILFKQFGVSITCVSLMIISSLQNQFDSSIRRDNDIEILKKNQQLILEKLDRLTNSIDKSKSALSKPCLLRPTLPGK